MSNKQLLIRDLLKKYDMYGKKVINTDYHLNILNHNVNSVLSRLARENLVEIDPGLSEEELAGLVLDLINKCDVQNQDYDSKLDEEMTRIGIATDKFRAFSNYSAWDDDFSCGTSFTSIYDDYVDSQFESDDIKRTR